ncbi:hypothetical protein [Leptospira kmetyi]|nr:hypothetical protein [Leptospira kmetyi]EQA54708.1 hypothetical protein LEP1GSC052_1712 [Leptospira kmetyi serovar Malaysia str. Bejo-Iso9]
MENETVPDGLKRLQSILPTNDIGSKTACKTTAPYIDKAHNRN